MTRVLRPGKKAEALASYQQVIQARTAAGQKPEEDLYKRAVQAAYDARLPSAGDIALQWVTAYPNTESWRNSIAIYRNSSKPDLEGTVDLLRLMRAAGSLNRAADSEPVRQRSRRTVQFHRGAERGRPGREDAGRGRGRSAEALRDAQLQAEGDGRGPRRPPPSRPRAGWHCCGSAIAIYGLGDYAKAAETYGAAKAKGADANLANLRTGIALAAAGNKAGAAAALNSVTGPRAGIAKYWLLYLQTKG